MKPGGGRAEPNGFAARTIWIYVVTFGTLGGVYWHRQRFLSWVNLACFFIFFVLAVGFRIRRRLRSAAARQG